MSSSLEGNHQPDARDKMVVHIEGQQARKLRARRTKDRGTWFGLGMMGTVGWTVVVVVLWVAYALLMIEMGYHTLADILTTAAVNLPIAAAAQLLPRRRTAPA